jgi:hypothetical protein
MNTHDEDRIKHLLRQAVSHVEAEPAPAPSTSLEPSYSLEPSIDLWPAVLRRLDRDSVARPPSRWIWFDWALAAGLAVVTVSFPASIPLLLYYL